MRALLTLVAWLLALLTGMVVFVAALTGLLLGVGARGNGEDCDCGDVREANANTVVVAQVAARYDDHLLLEVASVERGEAGATEVARSYGVELLPWRSYRLYLFDGGNAPPLNLTADVEPEPLELRWPTGWPSVGALPGVMRYGLAALPTFLVSTLVVLIERRNRARVERWRERATRAAVA